MVIIKSMQSLRQRLYFNNHTKLPAQANFCPSVKGFLLCNRDSSSSSHPTTTMGMSNNSSQTHNMDLLRPYQKRLLMQIKKFIDPAPSSSIKEREISSRSSKNITRILCPMATGLGKTVVFVNLPHIFPENQKYGTLILVHRDELVWQAAEALKFWSPHLKIGIEKGASHGDPKKDDVIVASVQTLGKKSTKTINLVNKRLLRYKNFGGIIIIDEAHHVKPDGTYDNVLNFFRVGSHANKRDNTPTVRFRENNAGKEGQVLSNYLKDGLHRISFGFTATPYRTDSISLGHFFDAAVPDLDIRWGILNGYLVDINVYTVRTITDLSGTRVRMRDFALNDLDRMINIDSRNAAVVKSIIKYGGEKCIVFCSSLNHAKCLVEKLQNENISADYIHGAMRKEDRQRIITNFKTGDLRVMANFSVLAEGFDAPNCDTIVMCRPTMSKGLYTQMIGRGTRPNVKLDNNMSLAVRLEAIRHSRKSNMRVIDFVDNCGKHKIVTMSSILNMNSAFQFNSENSDKDKDLTVRDVLEEINELLLDIKDDINKNEIVIELQNAKSIDEMKMIVQRYRLLDFAVGNSKPKTIQSLRPKYTNFSDIKIGDRLGYLGPKKIDPDSEDKSQYFEGPVITVDRIDLDVILDDDDDDDDNDFQDEDFLKRKKKRKRKSIPVHMIDYKNSVNFVWYTHGIKDSDKNELFEGARYRLKGIVHSIDKQNSSIEVTRCILESWDQEHDDNHDDGVSNNKKFG